MGSLFYRSFEEKYRGSVDEIKKRLSFYVPFVMLLKEHYRDGLIADIGCGRGEWLELLSENGIGNIGIDLDEGMLQRAEEAGLNVKKMDCIEYLKQQPDESLLAVTGFHIAEHLPFELLQCLVQESLRVLKPGGLLILETPNPENLSVGACLFYMDPTHNHPLPPPLLGFLPEHYGFTRTIAVRLQEKERLKNKDERVKLFDVLSEVSPDYSIIAQKSAEDSLFDKLTPLFDKQYGLGLDVLSERFEAGYEEENRQRDKENRQQDEKIETLSNELSGILKNISQLEEKITNTVEENRQLYQQIVDLKLSRSWRITAPYRYIGLQFKLLAQYGVKQRCKHLVKRIIKIIFRVVNNFPTIKSVLIKISKKIGIYHSIHRLYRRTQPEQGSKLQSETDSFSRLAKQLQNPDLIPPSVNEIYLKLTKNK